MQCYCCYYCYCYCYYCYCYYCYYCYYYYWYSYCEHRCWQRLQAVATWSQGSDSR